MIYLRYIKLNVIVRQKYKEYVENNYVPLFYRPYYLDASCIKGSWEVIENKDDFYVYHKRKKGPFSFVVNPQLTPYLGWVKNPKNNCSPLNFARSCEKLSGYPCLEQGAKYTYRIDTSVSVETLQNLLSRSHKRYVKKTEKRFRVREIQYDNFRDKIIEFFTLQGRTLPFDVQVLSRIDTALSNRDERLILGAYDENNAIRSLVYLVYDEQWMYLLASGYQPGFRSNYTLTWEAILRAKNMKLNFDFEGSMLPGVEQFYAGFGGYKSYCHTQRGCSSPFMEQLVSKIIPGF